MKNQCIISTSILSSNFKNLHNEIKDIENCGTDEIHIDVMDGEFVENLSFGLPIINTIRSSTKLPLEGHMMVNYPIKYVKSFADAGIDIFTFHIESKSPIMKTIELIKKQNLKVGIAINPDSSISLLQKYIDYIDRIIFMSVYPGKGGQKYIQSTEDKMIEFLSLNKNKNILLGVDGGIKSETIRGAYNAGARLFISGTGILDNKLGYYGAIDQLRRATLN